jgi:hypothetical protein
MQPRQSSAIAALILVLTAGLLVGCAGGSAQPGGPTSTTPSQSNGGPASGGLPSGKIQPSPTPTNRSQTGEMTLTGQVDEGVEPGCLVMKSGGTTYLLVGGDRTLVRVGQRITVRGRPNPEMITTCQQGTPFEVAEARLA